MQPTDRVNDDLNVTGTGPIYAVPIAVLRLLFAASVALFIGASSAFADDGYRLWLRYTPKPMAAQLALRTHAHWVVAPPTPTPTMTVALQELRRGLAGMAGSAPVPADTIAHDAIVLGTPGELADIARLNLDMSGLGAEGYLIRRVSIGGGYATVVTAQTDTGVLYGVFALLAHLQRGAALEAIDLASTPRLRLRMLDHWDNLDGSVERGYAGASLWDWWTLPDYSDPRYVDYARANASIGINAVVLNNVNASPEILSARYLAKAAALAAVLRPYGIHVFLAVNFASPMRLGGLPTADPQDPRVIAWWRTKTDELYRAIPDFGGFLVKANAEGQPGPQDFGRSHADGANMLAAALRPHHGVVIWRAFVYRTAGQADRANEAYDEFKPLDGTFADNVMVQVKNGPIDFQPREPFSPLFGAMPATSLMLELQLTKEYLGQATHLVYLGPLFHEVLQSDTYAHGQGSTVSRVIDGTLDHRLLTGIAGVANIGRDRDWCGSTFNQANWYAFGRLAWDPDADPTAIARDWAAMTFDPASRVVAPIVSIMMQSREAAVDYMTPLGLAHQMGTGHHYGPAPWVNDLPQPAWNPTYYARADRTGIGFDRTITGSNAVARYAPRVARRFADPKQVPDRLLLWFHHVPWTYRLHSGETVWAGLANHYQHGVEAVAAMARKWQMVKPWIDQERFTKTADFLAIQQREAEWWRDASMAYWSHVSGLPLPAGYPKAAHDLAYYESLRFPDAHGQPR